MTTALQRESGERFPSDDNSKSSDKILSPQKPPHAPDSPVRPPVSPITPAITYSQLATPLPPNGLPLLDPHDSSLAQSSVSKVQSPNKPTSAPQDRSAGLAHKTSPASLPKPTFITAPNPVPFDEADNTDAAALRAAISVLQIQKEKSRRDIKTLQQLRQGLLDNPDDFTEQLLAGRLREEKRPNDPLQATFASAGETTEDVSSSEDNEVVDDHRSSPPAAVVTEANTESKPPAQYPPIPSAQNVVRCPPINWAKYHIAGEPLERMHEEQRKRPAPSEPVRDATLLQQPLSTPVQQPPAPEHHVLAPYEPWRDKSSTPAEQLGLATQTKRVTPKKSDLNNSA